MQGRKLYGFSLLLMPIIKIFKDERYAQISNDLLNDNNLSLRAKGLLCYLISKPTTWNVNVSHLYGVCKEGKDAIYATINELIEAGYIVRHRLKNEQGKHIGVDYYVYEQPQREIPDVDNPNGEKPDISNTETSINKEDSKGPVAPAASSSSEKKEVTMTQRKINFLKLVIDYATTNPSKYPKLMYVEFAKYWVESSTQKKKVILRFEEQRFFDIGRRLSTWMQKVNEVTLHGYWDSETKVDTLNALFKKQILNINDTKEGQ